MTTPKTNELNEDVAAQFDIDMILTNDEGIIEANESDVEDVALLCDEVENDDVQYHQLFVTRMSLLLIKARKTMLHLRAKMKIQLNHLFKNLVNLPRNGALTQEQQNI